MSCRFIPPPPFFFLIYVCCFFFCFLPFNCCLPCHLLSILKKEERGRRRRRRLMSAFFFCSRYILCECSVCLSFFCRHVSTVFFLLVLLCVSFFFFFTVCCMHRVDALLNTPVGFFSLCRFFFLRCSVEFLPPKRTQSKAKISAVLSCSSPSLHIRRTFIHIHTSVHKNSHIIMTHGHVMTLSILTFRCLFLSIGFSRKRRRCADDVALSSYFFFSHASGCVVVTHAR
jgi:hypothetical protein